jgi:hypothetical protein
MTKYLISFPGSAMQLSAEEFEAAGRDAHAVVQEAKDAGVYVFGGGIAEDVPPFRVQVDGSVTDDTYPETRILTGGFMILELDSRADAIKWAEKTAVACRCAQEVREFMYDPES